MYTLSILILPFFISFDIRSVSPSIAAEAKYEFTRDLVTPHANLWNEQLKYLKGKPRYALEISSFEGRSAIGFLENILIYPISSITCVDIFEEKYGYEDKFDRNIQASGLANKVKKFKGFAEGFAGGGVVPS
jgi:hypothetical protein